MLSACSRLEKWVLLQRTTIAGPVPARCGGRVLFAKGRRLYYNAVHAQGAADGADIRAPLLLVSVRPAVNRLVKLLLLAALAILLYAGFLWPIPQHFAEGIPYGSYTPREMAPREMVQGDHLQLLYHFELLSSYLGGETPWFRNLWEFNLGDETVPARIDPCYAPFALPYAVLRHAGLGDAPAWNFCQWLSVWVGLVFCYLLARSHGAGKWASASIAAVALCVPYRWVTLAGGSPTGFGMGLVPGVALGIDWLSTSLLTNPDLAWFPIAFLSIWQGVAYSTLLYLAGLQTIDTEVYEAADIDGVNAWQRFWQITFPLIGPFFTINMVLSLKNSLSMFDQVVALTGGGPDSKTETVSYLIFSNGLGNGEYSYQMANAVTFFIVLAILAFIQLKFFSGKEQI